MCKTVWVLMGVGEPPEVVGTHGFLQLNMIFFIIYNTKVLKMSILTDKNIKEYVDWYISSGRDERTWSIIYKPEHRKAVYDYVATNPEFTVVSNYTADNQKMFCCDKWLISKNSSFKCNVCDKKFDIPYLKNNEELDNENIYFYNYRPYGGLSIFKTHLAPPLSDPTKELKKQFIYAKEF